MCVLAQAGEARRRVLLYKHPQLSRHRAVTTSRVATVTTMQSTMSQSSKMLADDGAGKAVVVDAETELPAVHRGLFAGAVVDADTELPVQHRMSVATRIIEAQRSTTLTSTVLARVAAGKASRKAGSR